MVAAFTVPAALAVATLLYGWFEAGWLRTRVLDVPVEGLPAALDGLRIAHLSDFHLGPPSRGAVAVRRAADWVRERRPDLVVVTGDLLSHPRGRDLLDEVLHGLDALAVLGNHDIGVTRDRFSRAVELEGLPATLLLGESRVVERRGARIQVSGTAPRPRALVPDVDSSAALRILLTHYPRLVSGYELVLAGHMHAGQIVVPYPGGKLRLAHLRARLTEGVYRRGGTTLHVSPGLGTTFVPFRFFARPEATELTLRCSEVQLDAYYGDASTPCRRVAVARRPPTRGSQPVLRISKRIPPLSGLPQKLNRVSVRSKPSLVRRGLE